MSSCWRAREAPAPPPGGPQACAGGRDPMTFQHMISAMPYKSPAEPTALKLGFLVSELTRFFSLGSLALVQVWTSSSGGRWSGIAKSQLNATVLQTHQYAAVVQQADLLNFRHKSCQRGITGAALGMLGKVWSSGALQVVQNVAIIPHTVHPRDKLDGNACGAMAELVYIPIYDLAAPETGVRAVLEVVISSTATDVMVPNVISLVGMLLEELKLSLSKPTAESLAAAAPAPSTPPRVPSPPAAPKPLPAAQMQTPRPGPGLGRTLSMRCLDSCLDMLPESCAIGAVADKLHAYVPRRVAVAGAGPA